MTVGRFDYFFPCCHVQGRPIIEVNPNPHGTVNSVSFGGKTKCHYPSHVLWFTYIVPQLWIYIALGMRFVQGLSPAESALMLMLWRSICLACDSHMDRSLMQFFWPCQICTYWLIHAFPSSHIITRIPCWSWALVLVCMHWRLQSPFLTSAGWSAWERIVHFHSGHHIWR